MQAILGRDEQGREGHAPKVWPVGGQESQLCQPQRTINWESKIACLMDSSQRNVDRHDHA